MIVLILFSGRTFSYASGVINSTSHYRIGFDCMIADCEFNCFKLANLSNVLCTYTHNSAICLAIITQISNPLIYNFSK